MRRVYGHPHWIILDEEHHLTPSNAPIEHTIPAGDLNNFMLISTSPHALSHALFSRVGMVITVVDNEKYILEQFCQIRDLAVPENIPCLAAGEACVWETDHPMSLYKIRYNMPQLLQRRHKRKYAFGDMAYNSFVFTGRENKMQLKAGNLMMFVQLAEGIDDDTWLYHLERSDYKNWVDGCIHDKSLARVMEQAAKHNPDAQTSKKIILDYIKEKYTAV